MRINVKDIVYAALIAAAYAAITFAIAPISSGLMQIRLSEAFCVMPAFTSAAVPGLFLGCALANILVGAALPDIIFGSLATLAAAALTYWMSKKGFNKWLLPMPAVILNGIVVGFLLHYVYQVGVSLPLCMAYVAGGQLLSCYGLGMPLMNVLSRVQFFSKE